MSERFKPLGQYVYEKGERIGCSVEEAAVELSRKLNAYQMRIERLKAEVERLRIAGGESEPRFVLLSDYRHLKAENERLRKAGDELSLAYHTICRDSYCDGWLRPFMTLADFKVKEVEAWNAAKEGRPNE